MDFEFTEEERLWRDTVRGFFKKEVAPRWVEMDEKGEFPVELIQRMAKVGLIGTILSSEYGGQDGSFVMTAAALEEAGYADPSIGTAVYLLINNAWPYMLQLRGSKEAKREILPRITKGEAVFGIWSTEAQGGSDVAGFRTLKATKKDERTWILNGEKVMVSMAPMIEKMPWGGGGFLIARSGPVEARHKAITNFAAVVKRNGRNLPGFEYSVYEEIGRHSVKTGAITFTDFEIDDMYRIGDVNKGFQVAMEGFNLARSFIGMASVGAARWALNEGLRWIRERKLWGKPLAAFQGISFKFAELYTELEATRWLCYKAAWLADRYYRLRDPSVSLRDVAIATTSAKLKAPELAAEICHEVMKWHGGMAYFKEIPLYRAWEGITSYVVGAEGSQNIMRYLIARNVIGKEYTPL